MLTCDVGVQEQWCGAAVDVCPSTTIFSIFSIFIARILCLVAADDAALECGTSAGVFDVQASSCDCCVAWIDRANAA